MIKFQTWIKNKLKEEKLEDIPDVLKQMFHNSETKKPEEDIPMLPMFLKRDKTAHTTTTKPTRKPGSAPLINRVRNRGKND